MKKGSGMRKSGPRPVTPPRPVTSRPVVGPRVAGPRRVVAGPGGCLRSLISTVVILLILAVVYFVFLAR